MQSLKRLSIAERLAALAGLAAAVASLAGYVPGLYRDPRDVVVQSHGYDLGNLVVVAVLGLGLAASARGSIRGRLVAIGALGCLIYSYVTYAFLIVLNPATLLYIAVLGLGGWSFVAGLASVDEVEVEASVADRLPRRATAGFLIVIAALFAANWLAQIAGSVSSGKLPTDLQAVGWPMNPVFVLDLGFVLPLMALTGVRLLTARPGGVRLAIPLLVFIPVLAASILLLSVAAAIDGQTFEPLVAVMLIVAGVLSVALAAPALELRWNRPGAAPPQDV